MSSAKSIRKSPSSQKGNQQQREQHHNTGSSQRNLGDKQPGPDLFYNNGALASDQNKNSDLQVVSADELEDGVVLEV